MHASYYHKAHACIMVRTLVVLPSGGVIGNLERGQQAAWEGIEPNGAKWLMSCLTRDRTEVGPQ